jgi:hypothetical protein
MLKRTLGRSLITLLVVTGLAGTINNSSISKKERKHAVTMMKETKSDAINSVKDLSTTQLEFKTAPDKWSAKDCMMHIAGAEKLLWSLLETSMKGPANPEKRSEIKMTDEQIVEVIKNRTSKFQAPEPIQPKNTGYRSFEEAMDDFKQTRGEHIKYLKSSTEDLRNHVVQMPFGWIDCYQLCLFIAGHSNRHTQQINEVKANAAFPKQ